MPTGFWATQYDSVQHTKVPADPKIVIFEWENQINKGLKRRSKLVSSKSDVVRVHHSLRGHSGAPFMSLTEAGTKDVS